MPRSAMLLEPVDPNERFRARRRQARRRQTVRRLTLLAVVTLAAAGATLGARFLGEDSVRPGANSESPPGQAATPPPPPKPEPRPYPDEMRGVHVTMALASLDGKFDEYLALTREGLNTIELDVKDENGEIGFRARVPLARKIGAARTYYDAVEVVEKVRAKGVYLIGRVVVFEDPLLSTQRPRFAIRNPDGSVWRNSAGLGWTNPYDKRVWKYNVDIAVDAAKAGFDEIQFDYIRFPTDGNIESAVYAGKRKEKRNGTIARFLEYARGRLEPLGVRMSADVFGLSATRNMGIGQTPRRLARYLDAIYPMVYPSHYGPGELGLADPNAEPGRTVALSLRDFAADLTGQDTRLVPWLQDFSLGREYSKDDVRLQILAARDASADGFLLWNPSGIYTRGVLSAPE
jgi:hypothetical protein